MVFAITTFRGALRLGVSYRTADVSRETVEQVAGALVEEIRALPGRTRESC
jgi:hypothetical protein